MKLTNHGSVPVYTISGSSTARPLPEWLARKRKRSLKQDPEYAQRIELLQDFEFEEASSCIRISDDGDWIVSTGTYKPQIHVHHLPHLSLFFSRHTKALNQTFVLLSSDYSKSLHLQTDRVLEFHTPSGCHHTTRIPRYGRDLKYDKRTAEALVTSAGVDPTTQYGEVFRLNLEIGRFMKPYPIDVGGDDHSSVGAGALQGGIDAGSVNAAAIAEDSHNLLAFGTSLGTVELWDSRSRKRVGLLQPARSLIESSSPSQSSRAGISALEFDHSGLSLATGSSNGLIHLYDLRSPSPLLKKDQGYGYPIHTLTFLSSPSTRSNYTSVTNPLILSADKRIIKIWDQHDGTPWTHIEAAVDLHCVTWCKDSGMLLTANEGRQQHSFFIPQLGPAPRWCSFLDNLVEEMAEDSTDPNAYATGTVGTSGGGGEVYDNYKFVTLQDLRGLNLEDKIGTALLKPYMHGYFMRQELYEEARILAQPDLWAQQRQKSIQEKIDKERESRIRGSKKAVNAKVNKKLAEKMLEREEKNELRKAKRALRKEETNATNAPITSTPADDITEEEQNAKAPSLSETVPTPANQLDSRNGLLNDPRFASLFQDEDFEIDEASHVFRALNPSTHTADKEISASSQRRGLTAVEEEEADTAPVRSSEESEADSEDLSSHGESRDGEHHNTTPANGSSNGNGISYRRSAKQGKNQSTHPDRRRVTKNTARGPEMRVSSSSGASHAPRKNRTFGDQMRVLNDRDVAAPGRRSGASGMVVGEKQLKFASAGKKGSRAAAADAKSDKSGGARSWKERRSASGNTLRNL